MTVKKCILIHLLLVLGLFSGCTDNTASKDSILVFSSASLRNVMQDIGNDYQKKTGTSVVFNFAGSNVLAKQIEAATQADIYLSANVQWVEYLAEKDLILNSSKRTFLSNNLVVVAQKDSAWELNDPAQLGSLPFKFLSLGDPAAVPAGRYAKQYLNSIAVWESVKDRVLPAPDVRAAASMVENMSNIIGIVYKTDALASRKLKILYEVKNEGNGQLERVKYVAVSVKKKSSKSQAQQIAPNVSGFLDYLMQDEAKLVFKRHGFATINENNSHVSE